MCVAFKITFCQGFHLLAVYTSSVRGKEVHWTSITPIASSSPAQKLLTECLLPNINSYVKTSYLASFTPWDWHTKNRHHTHCRCNLYPTERNNNYTSSLPPSFPIKKKFFTAGVSFRKTFRSLKLLLTSFFAPRTWLVKCWLAAYAQSTPMLQKIQLTDIYYCECPLWHFKTE